MLFLANCCQAADSVILPGSSLDSTYGRHRSEFNMFRKLHFTWWRLKKKKKPNFENSWCSAWDEYTFRVCLKTELGVSLLAYAACGWAQVVSLLAPSASWLFTGEWSDSSHTGSRSAVVVSLPPFWKVRGSRGPGSIFSHSSTWTLPHTSHKMKAMCHKLVPTGCCHGFHIGRSS